MLPWACNKALNGMMNSRYLCLFEMLILLCSLIVFNRIRRIICVTSRMSWCQQLPSCDKSQKCLSCPKSDWLYSWIVHDHHEMYLISALIAVNLISCPQVWLVVHVVPFCALLPSAAEIIQKKLLQIRVAQSWIQKRHLLLSSLFSCVHLLDGTHLMQSHICRDLSPARATHARRWPSGARACGEQDGTTLTSDINRFVRSCTICL